MHDKFKEVISDRFVAFEQHTKGIGMGLLSKMAYEGGGLGKTGQVITNSIMVEERQNYQGLGYSQR